MLLVCVILILAIFSTKSEMHKPFSEAKAEGILGLQAEHYFLLDLRYSAASSTSY